MSLTEKLIIDSKLKLYDDLLDFMFWTIIVFDVDYSYTRDAFISFSNEIPGPLADVTIKCENWQNRNIWIDKLEKLYCEIKHDNNLLSGTGSELKSYLNFIIERNELNRLL